MYKMVLKLNYPPDLCLTDGMEIWFLLHDFTFKKIHNCFSLIHASSYTDEMGKTQTWIHL